MDNYAVSHDEAIFPDSHAYNPARWLNDQSPERETALAVYGGFREGYPILRRHAARVCETVHRARDGVQALELYDTDRSAVDFYIYAFVPRPRPGTKGVRVLVK